MSEVPVEHRIFFLFISLIGISAFMGGTALLYANEGSADFSILAQKAMVVDADNAAVASLKPGTPLMIEGAVSTSEQVGDGDLFPAGDYVAVRRSVQMFAWVRRGGRYTYYEKDWTYEPFIGTSGGYTNPAPFLPGEVFVARSAKLGRFSIADTPHMMMPGGILAKGPVFMPAPGSGGTMSAPQIGDELVSYGTVPSGSEVAVLGSLSDNTVVPYADNEYGSVYRLFLGNRNDAISILHSEFESTAWLVRFVGMILIFLSLGIIVRLKHIGQPERQSRVALLMRTFGPAILYSAFVVLVSMLVHGRLSL